MEKITIEVNDDIASKWLKTPVRLRKRLENQFIAGINNSEKFNDDFWNFLESERKKADQKGFNNEILNEIINES
ncbi:MAG: hypothetical protein IPP61_09485 [Cytophagaceae bacterium]|nr:hypothetical protein [Cytophagaceae bacterium]MBK9933715.1 hypothetical protein [Cytophagaceae bacterium]MBL0302570.1 hypothetical protein [Cytophagaceae bacterium]MBL0325397.1 hypothetical protein [Cytophagaceae bacterium]